MTRATLMCLAAFAAAMLSACERREISGPPAIRLGLDGCVACGMLVMEDRCSCALLIVSDGSRKHLVFDDLGMLAERGAEQVWVDAELVGVRECVVEATLWVLDASKARPARTGAVDQRDLIRYLVANQRLGVVVEVGDEDSVGEHAGSDRLTAGVDGFEDA